MDVVRQNQLFDIHTLRKQPALQVYGLMEVDCAVIVTVNEQHR